MADNSKDGMRQNIESIFINLFTSDETINELFDKMLKKKATYKEVDKFAEVIGNLLSVAIKQSIPDGETIEYDQLAILSDMMPKLLKNNHTLITDFGARVQKQLNNNFGVGLNAVKPKIDNARVARIQEQILESVDNIRLENVISEPIINYSMSIVTSMIFENLEFQYNAGLSPRISRKSAGDCCEWCQNLAGVFEYTKHPEDIFKRHKFCRCLVEYQEPNSKKVNVHTRKNTSSEDYKRLYRERETERKVKRQKESAYRLSKYGSYNKY